MPVYTCTLTQDTLTAYTKATLAAEITRLHSSINHVPSTYVNVVFHELPPENVYTDSVPARPLLINGWARSGHPQELTTELALQIATACSRVTGIDKNNVLVVIQDSPASSAVEGGRVLPEPGQEQAWIRSSRRERQ
jgi:phenylpyruvate tautomerase PptA (4-oxalocrotonate tautomerase family)